MLEIATEILNKLHNIYWVLMAILFWITIGVGIQIGRMFGRR